MSRKDRAQYRKDAALYRQRHPERIATRNRKFRENHRGYYASKSFEWRQNHPTTRYVQQYKLDHPCADCGENDPVVLEFDHVRGEKSFTIGQNVCSHSVEEVQDEIAKCDVACANCHRRRTARRVGERMESRRQTSTKLLEQVFEEE